MSKKEKKSLVTVYYRLVHTSPLMAKVVVVPTLKEPSQTLVAAEQKLMSGQDKTTIRVITSDFHTPKKEDVDEDKTQSPSDENKQD